MAQYPILRITKGSPLTYVEMDGNLSWLAANLNGSPNVYITGSSVNITGSTNIIGDLVVRGTGSFDVLLMNYFSSSILYSSGSTKFGDTQDDTHQFTGSVFITGSTLSLSGGNFSGSGANLFGIPYTAIVGLNLSRIATGSISASVDTGTNAFSVTSGSRTYLNIFNTGRTWIGNRTSSVDAGYQLDIQDGDVRFKNTVLKTDSVYNLSIGNGAANAPAGGYSVFIGALAGELSSNLVYTIGIGYAAGYGTNDASHSVFLGTQAGQYAARSQYAHMIGNGAGFSSNDSQYSNFIGKDAARSAYSSSYSNFFGQRAGINANNSSNSNFFGSETGAGGNRMTYVNAIGAGAAALATNIDQSTFIGKDVAYSVSNITHSIFIGHAAGRLASGASYSTFIGYVAGANYTHIVTGSNNIVIGTNITTPDAGSNNTLNIGGVLFGANLYGTVSGNPSKLGQANGQIGINTPIPNAAAALEITSINRGFLPTRTNSTASISNPVQGLMTFITASGGGQGLWQFLSGSGWVQMLHFSSSISASQVIGLSLDTSRIVTGSVTASVGVGTDTFNVRSGSTSYFNIFNSGRTWIGTGNPVDPGVGYNLYVPDSSSFGRAFATTAVINSLSNVSGQSTNGSPYQFQFSTGVQNDTYLPLYINKGDGNGSGGNWGGAIGIGFGVQNGSQSRPAKAAIVFEGTDTWNRGDLHLVVNSVPDSSTPTTSSLHKRITAQYDGTVILNPVLGSTLIGPSGSLIPARLTLLGTGITSATNALLVQNSASIDLFRIRDNGQQVISSPLMTLSSSNSGYLISQSLTHSGSNALFSRLIGVNITPTFFSTTASQTETALRVSPTFTGSYTGSLMTNVIVDFGTTTSGSILLIDDVTSGSVYAVNDYFGLPVFEIFSDAQVNMYDYPYAVFNKSGSYLNLGLPSTVAVDSAVNMRADVVMDEGLGFFTRTAQGNGTTLNDSTASLYTYTFGAASGSVFISAIVTGYDSASRDMISGEVKSSIRYRAGAAAIVGTNFRLINADNSRVGFDVSVSSNTAILRAYGTGSRTYIWGATITTQII